MDAITAEGLVKIYRGRKTEVRLELKELYSALEEAKADVMGIYDILALVDKGVMPKSLLTSLEPSYVAGLFRSARFGVHEAHGQGVVAQFNYLVKNGAVSSDGKGKYRTDPSKFAAGIKALTDAPRWLQREALSGHLWREGDCEGCPGFCAR